MSTETRSAGLSLSKDSRLVLSQLPGFRATVTVGGSATTFTISTAIIASELPTDSSLLATQAALYSGSTPGMAVILSCAAGAANQGAAANITAIVTGTGVVTVASNSLFTSLAAGDVVAILPPLSVNLFLPNGHTMESQLENDHTKGTNETFDTHNTAMGVPVGGDVPLFQILTSEGLGRTLAIGVGGYKNATTTHTYRPMMNDDGTFDNSSDATLYAQDGNGVIRRAFFGNFGTKLQLDWPENARSMASLSVLGNGSVREIGGTNRVFPTGASSWDRTGLNCDTGPGITFRSVFVELGGSFGAGLTSAAEKFMRELHVTIDRGALADNTLGDAYIVKPVEDTHSITVTGRGILQTDTIKEDADGGVNDAEPASGFKTETRMLIKAVSPNDATKTLTIDIPRGIFSNDVIDRPRGRYMQNFEFKGLATLLGTGCVSTATPLYQITRSAESKNYLTAV